MLMGETKVLQGDECVSKYAKTISQCVILSVSTTLSCDHMRIFAYNDIFPL